MTTNNTLEYKFILTLGDWSGDGHNKYIDFDFITNHKIEDIRNAYIKSCKLTGLQFDDGDNYTGLSNMQDWRRICTEHEESGIYPQACKILLKYDLIDWEDLDSDGFLNIWNGYGIDWFAYLILDFIKLSLPDFEYKMVEKDGSLYLNGYWNNSLNVQFGYGLTGD